MKKILLFISFISLLLVVLIISQLFKTTSDNDVSSDQDNVEVGSVTNLRPLAADVSIYDDTVSDWRVVADETALVDGSRLKTSVTGRALVTRGDEIVTAINSNSELTLSLSEDQKSNILKLIVGQTWTKITRALEQDEVYEVHTPTMVAAVRGTSFGVGTNPPQVVVTEGIVWATAIDPETGLPDSETTVIVDAGFIVVFENGELVVREINADDKDSWFFEHNPELEKEEKEVEEVAEAVMEQIPVSVEEVVDNNIQPPVPVVLPPTSTPPQVTIDEVSPTTFDLTVEERLVVRGDNLNLVDRVVIDGKDVDFYVTTVGVLVIEKSELPTREGDYGVTLFYADTSVSKNRAFEILDSDPIEITISAVVAGFTTSQASYVEVRGSGFLLVESLLVNGQNNQFSIIDDNVIHIPDFSIDNVRTIELSGSNLQASYTM